MPTKKELEEQVAALELTNESLREENTRLKDVRNQPGYSGKVPPNKPNPKG